MPKVSKVGKFRATAALDKEKQKNVSSTTSSYVKDEVDLAVTTTNSSCDNNTSNSKAEGLSRGQRRRLAKRDQYLKREQMILSSLRLSREQEQRHQIDGLDSLWQALPTLNKEEENEKGRTDENTSRIIRKNKQKKNIAMEEVMHYNLVLQHPSFQSNPFETMKQHLRNTLVAETVEEQQPTTKHHKVKKDKESKGIKKAAVSKEKNQTKHSKYKKEKKNLYTSTKQKSPIRRGGSSSVKRKIRN